MVSELLDFAGRTRPTPAFGEMELDSLDVTLVVPHDGAWLQGVEELKTLYRRFRTYCYRDSRGRSWYGVLRAITFKDVPEGTVCSFTFDRTTYSAIPASQSVVPVEES